MYIMDENDYEEIISTLAKCGRPDLIESFKECVKRDANYSPTAKEKRDYRRKESLSVSEGSAEEEDLIIKDEGGGHFSLV